MTFIATEPLDILFDGISSNIKSCVAVLQYILTLKGVVLLVSK